MSLYQLLAAICNSEHSHGQIMIQQAPGHRYLKRSRSNTPRINLCGRLASVFDSLWLIFCLVFVSLWSFCD